MTIFIEFNEVFIQNQHCTLVLAYAYFPHA